MLDDRSLNGVFVNGERVDLKELSDGDSVTAGRFSLYFMSLEGEPSDAAQPHHEAIA